MLELESVHVPKTAGLSFALILEHWYGAQHVARHTSAYASPVHLDTTVMHGHFPAGTYNARQRVCWLRDPAARLVSHYAFLRYQHAPGNASRFLATHQRIWSGDVSFEEFVHLPDVQHGVAQQLNGLDVDDFDFVGIQEEFGRELVRCAHVLGKPVVSVDGGENVTTAPEYAELRASLTSADLQELRELNPGCTALYERARARSAAWWAQHEDLAHRAA